MILVTGATGNFGKAAIHSLRKKRPSSRVVGLARDPSRAADIVKAGVEIRRGDYTNYDSLVRAFSGVDRLLFVSSSALRGVAEQHANVIRAAKEAGVRYVAYTSIVNLPHITRVPLVADYRETEEALKASGLTYTILRNGYYMDMLPTFIGEVQSTGRIRCPAGDGRASFAARADLAEAAASVIAGKGHDRGIYELNTGRSYSFHDVAQALTKALGTTIAYEDAPSEQWAHSLRAQGMPEAEIELMVDLAASICFSEADKPTGDLKRLLGREPIDLEEFLKAAYTRPNAAAPMSVGGSSISRRSLNAALAASFTARVISQLSSRRRP